MASGNARARISRFNKISRFVVDAKTGGSHVKTVCWLCAGTETFSGGKHKWATLNEGVITAANLPPYYGTSAS